MAQPVQTSTKWKVAAQIEELVKAECRFWPSSAAKVRTHLGYDEEDFEKLMELRWPLVFACDLADVLDLEVRVSRSPVHVL